jgi:hypothetical protein
MAEGLSMLTLHENVTLTIEDGTEINIMEIIPKSEPIEDYASKITLDFREDSCSEDACGFSINCCCPNLENVLGYEAGGVGALGSCGGTEDGYRYMVNDGGNFRIYECIAGDDWTRQTDEEVEGNCVYDENTGSVWDYPQYWYYHDLINSFQLLCYLGSVSNNGDGTATLDGSGAEADEFDCVIYVQAQYKTHESATWLDIGGPVSLETFDADGITVTTGAGDFDFRVKYYSHNCDLSYAGDVNQEIFTSDEMEDVWDAFTTKPTSAVLTAMDTMMSGFVNGGYFAKAEFIDIFAVHINTAAEAQINWHDPGTFNPILSGPPIFTA